MLKAVDRWPAAVDFRRPGLKGHKFLDGSPQAVEEPQRWGREPRIVCHPTQPIITAGCSRGCRRYRAMKEGHPNTMVQASGDLRGQRVVPPHGTQQMCGQAALKY